MFYESLIDNMKIGKTYNINKENLIFIEKNNTILDLKYVLEKEAILSKLIKKYDLEPETSIYLYEGNLIGENVLEIKNKEYLFPFLIDRKLYCYGTNEVIEDNTKFYYKNLNIFSESYFNTSGTTLDELISNQTKVFNNYIDFLEFIKLEINNCKKGIKIFDKKYSEEIYFKKENIRRIDLLREMLRVSFRKVFEPNYYYVGWKDYIKLWKKYSIRGFRNYFDFIDFVNDMITELETQIMNFKEEWAGKSTIHFYGTRLNNEKDCKREIKKYRDMLKKYFRENKEIKKGILKRFFLK